MTLEQLYKLAIRKYGAEVQENQAIEECAELITAINHKHRGREHNIAEEISDVEIMLEQLKITNFQTQKCEVQTKLLTTSAPTADVVKVVRCKDCKHKVDALGRTMCNRTAIKKGNGWFGLTATEENHFCSYGELKEREGK